MTDKRKTDRESRTWFRSDRFFLDQGAWYFQTREGTIEGPFDCRNSANRYLDNYIKVHQSGWLPGTNGLTLV